MLFALSDFESKKLEIMLNISANFFIMSPCLLHSLIVHKNGPSILRICSKNTDQKTAQLGKSYVEFIPKKLKYKFFESYQK